MTVLFRGDPITPAHLPVGPAAPSPCAACMAAEMFELVSSHRCDGTTTITSVGAVLLPGDPQPCPCSCRRAIARAQAIGRSLGRAEKLGQERVRPEALRHVTEELRAHVGAILPGAEAATYLLPDQDQRVRRSRLASIRRHVDAEMGESTLAAHVYVSTLRTECAYLLAEYGVLEHSPGGK